ncbi:hypothetical protein [Hamadaea tsunoensis]|uniref:hypothetical protein n=1 Tax=Hamadaea tsunoensis TaxID=53368 RepID=UPI0004160BE7|nr:hypothetical protein [Hamadaea tsunoensis]
MDGAELWFDRADKLATLGGHEAEAERLLRDAIAAGHEPALARLADFLWYESGRDEQTVFTEVAELLSRAVDKAVPGAANAFANVLVDMEQDERAEAMYRRAISAGDRAAATNLAALLHGRGDDRAAYDVLVPAAKGGDDFAYQILGMNLSPTDPVWADITEAWSAARATDDPPSVFCHRPGAWALDLTDKPGETQASA